MAATVGWHRLEHQVKDAIEERGKGMVHEQAGGRVRQHTQCRLCEMKSGDADNAVRDVLVVFAHFSPVQTRTHRLLNIGLVGLGQAETNLIVANPDHVVLAQTRLAMNQLAIDRNELVMDFATTKNSPLRETISAYRGQALSPPNRTPLSHLHIGRYGAWTPLTGPRHQAT